MEKLILLSDLKPNPTNPRVIKDEKFRKLVRSVKDFPKMMTLRPIIIDDNGVVQGGNMRLKALEFLEYKEIPESWVKRATDFTPEELKEFIIKDNVGFGEWDWDSLETFADLDKLMSWGIDMPDLSGAPELTGDFNDEGISARNQYGVIVICKDAVQQETIFTELQSRGLQCKIVVT